MSFEKIVEIKIREAIEKGEFDGLQGSGQKLDLSAYFDTPEEIRVAYSVLKSAGILPEEAEILREIHELKEKIDRNKDQTTLNQLRRQLEEATLKFNLLMEGYKKKSARK